MSDSTSDAQNSNSVPRPVTRERLAAEQVVRPWARAVDGATDSSLTLTEEQIKQLEAKMGRAIDV